jgi:polyphosphate kinase
MITGYSQPQVFRRIEAAPIGLRQRLLGLIRGETERKRQGQRAGITVKTNSLVDREIIEALCEASQAGVPVRLNVRGICCLRPGVPRRSETVTVVSIVDRWLEHSRIFHFHHGGENAVYIASADWMPRNLDRRVELMVPVDDPECRGRLLDILETYFRDNVKARLLGSDGVYRRVDPGRRRRVRSQEALYRAAREAVREARRARPVVFEPHRKG